MKHTSRSLIFASLFFFILPHGTLHGQDSLANTSVDVSKINYLQHISKNIGSAYINSNTSLFEAYDSIQFKPGPIHKNRIPGKYVSKKCIIRFSLINNSDTSINIYFFPGLYYKKIQLYQLENGKPVIVNSVLPKNKDGYGFRQITLAGHDSAVYVAELGFLKTYNNSLRPRLIHPAYLNSFISDVHNSHASEDTLTYIFSGLLLLIVLLSLAGYIQGANSEFLYYAGYAFFTGFMLLTKSLYNFTSNPVNFFFEGYFDFILQGAGIMFYVLFMQKFLNTRQNHRFLFYMYFSATVFLVLSLASYTFFHYFTDNFIVENQVENTTKILLLLSIVVLLVYSLRHWKNKLFRYLFWGNLCLLFFSLLSQAIIMLDPLLNNLSKLLSSSLFYYETGLILELIFFLLALNHKTRSQLVEQTREREILKAENLKKEYEKELAVLKAQKEERERISADMHDELGSGMTAIRLLSEIARNKMKENTPVEIEKISHSANDVLNKMNAIIWSMSSMNDTLDNLVSYIRVFALEYFEGTNIECRVTIPDNIPSVELVGDKRRNIFLSLKETLTNAMKHSKASLINIEIITNHSLQIIVKDNGVGIDKQHIRQFGNGLKNISKRMESIGGSFHIENNNGTVTILELPF